jgi:hypothetical protein
MTTTTSSTYTLSGSRATGVKVVVGSTLVNNVTIGAVTYPTSTSWECVVSNLQVGTNEFVIGYPNDGKVCKPVSKTIEYMPVSGLPRIQPSFPLQRAGVSSITINAASPSEDAITSATINGVAVTIAYSVHREWMRFSRANVPLAVGNNTITITATNSVGTTTLVQTIVRPATETPDVQIISPVKIINKDQWYLQVLSYTATSVTATLNGTALSTPIYSANALGWAGSEKMYSFNMSSIPLGINSVIITATANGVSSKLSWVFERVVSDNGLSLPLSMSSPLNTPPYKPLDLYATMVSGGFSLVCIASISPNGLHPITYRLFRNGTRYPDNTTEFSTIPMTVSIGGNDSASWTLQAVDSLGQVSAISDSVDVTVTAYPSISADSISTNSSISTANAIGKVVGDTIVSTTALSSASIDTLVQLVADTIVNSSTLNIAQILEVLPLTADNLDHISELYSSTLLTFVGGGSIRSPSNINKIVFNANGQKIIIKNYINGSWK